MTPVAQIAFIQYALEEEVLTPEECKLLLMYSDRWGSPDNDTLVNEIQAIIDSHGLMKETVDNDIPSS